MEQAVKVSLCQRAIKLYGNGEVERRKYLSCQCHVNRARVRANTVTKHSVSTLQEHERVQCDSVSIVRARGSHRSLLGLGYVVAPCLVLAIM